MFLTEILGWTEGLNEETDASSDTDQNDVTRLDKYLFLTEQVGWHKGLQLFEERGEKAGED